MRSAVSGLVAGPLIIAAVAGPAGQPGCSCSPPPRGAGTGAAKPAPAPQGQVRREAPPLVAPGAAPPRVRPMALKDDRTGVIFYFESDGQHVAAVDKDGNVLWHKNPAEEGSIRGFSKNGATAWPTICYAGPPLDWTVRVMNDRGKKGEYVGVGFNTKHFGLLDRQTGEFTLMGND